MARHRAVQWLTAVAPDSKIASRSNSVLGLVYAVKSGAGVGPLPTAIADADDDLVRVLGPIPKLARSWRLLTHPGLRRTPRISAFFDFVAEERAALRTIFTG
jgi:DNA-binding transcriptional LysR family regulator